MKEQFFIFHGYGGENSLMPLADFVGQKGHPTLMIDDQKFPYRRFEMHDRLAEIKASYQVVFITSAHLWFDEYNYRFNYGCDPNMISAIELLEFLNPCFSAFYPHDMECFMHPSEMRWLDLFDLVMLPYQHNLFYRLKRCCQWVEIVGWIKKHKETKLNINTDEPTYSPTLFPSNIVSFYSQLGAEGYADWFRRYIGSDIPIKMPAGDNGVYPILKGEGYPFLNPSMSIYDTMEEYNLIIGSGHSSIIYEAAFSGIPVISLLDGVFPDEVYLKNISGISGIYPVHPDELHGFLSEINNKHTLLETGPDILKPFDFGKVYRYLTNHQA